jgi:hypothetical protein
VSGRVPVIYLALDPADPLIEIFADLGAVWAWDAATLSVLASREANGDAICADAALLHATSQTRYEVAGPSEPTPLDTALASLWTALVTLQRHPGSLSFEAVGWVWGVFGALSHLVVPVDSYDRYARAAWGTTALSDAGGKAEAYARNALHKDDREHWQLLANDLDEAIQAARRSNPKPKALADWVRERVERRQLGSLIAVRNRPSKQAVAAYLQERPDVPLGWDGFVHVASFPDLLSARVRLGTGEVLYTGPVAASYAGLLALPTAERLTVLAHGPWEVSRVVRQVENATDRLAELAHGETRAKASARLFGGRRIYQEIDPVPVRLHQIGLKVPAHVAPSAREAVWNPFDIRIVGAIGRTDRDSEGPARSEGSSHRDRVEALLIRFADGAGFFEPSHIVSRVANGEITEVAAKSLSRDDHIILVEGGARRDLFDVIVQKLERLPEFETIGMLIHEWQERARRAGYESGLSAAEILARMGPDAYITSPQTIVTWFRGLVHGPLSADDIRRFGHAVGDEFLQTRWEAVARALTTMRAHRRRVGQMLAKVLDGITPTDLEDSGYFDRRLGIHVSDLTEALSAHVVVEREESPVLIGYSYANRLLTANEVDHINVIRQIASV